MTRVERVRARDARDARDAREAREVALAREVRERACAHVRPVHLDPGGSNSPPDEPPGRSANIHHSAHPSLA